MGEHAPADAGFVKASKHRVAVVRRLAQSPAIPKELKEDTNRPYSRVSDALDNLRDQGLVELLVPEEQTKGRLYALTERGEECWQFMISQGMIEPND
jgi:DNA-binding MarR family transcriptional regulator